MNPLIIKLADVLERKFPTKMTSIQIHIHTFHTGGREIEFWVHTPHGIRCFLDPLDMQDYVMQFDDLTVDTVLKGWNL